MYMVYGWLIIATVCFGVCSYSIGTSDDPDEGDVFGLFFVAFAMSIAWPIILACTIIFGPFYLLFKMGRKKTEIKKSKAEMLNVLKR